MHIFASGLVFLIPVLGLIAGLSLSVTIPVFMLVALYVIKDEVQVNLGNVKLEWLFFLFMGASVSWAVMPMFSLLSFVKTLGLFFAAKLLLDNAKLLARRVAVSSNLLVASILATLALYYFETGLDGTLSSWFRDVVQLKDNTNFYLYYLDRGCTLLAMFSWVVIAALIKKEQRFTAFCLFVFVAFTLAISDSLSAFVGIMAGAVVFILTRAPFFRSSWLLSFLLIAFTAAFFYASLIIEPRKVSDEYDFLPISAKHRLFIWNYTAEKALEKPITGHGFNASRHLNDGDIDAVEYNGARLSLLPNHPHNNIMQIALEGGAIGFALYIMLLCKYIFAINRFFDRDRSGLIPSLRSASFALLANFLVMSLISFNMWQSWWVASFLWIAIMMAQTVGRDEVDESIKLIEDKKGN